MLAAAALAVAGCSRSPQSTAPVSGEQGPEAGSRADAVLHEQVNVAEDRLQRTYRGSEWSLSVAREAGWRRDPDDASTLTLSRDANGVALVLRLRAFAVRPGMDPIAFLAAHAMWIAEENGPRVEYNWDRRLQAWQGYAVSADRETYYLFRVVGDRACVLEETAESGTFDAHALDEFEQIAADFKCTPRTRRGPATEPPSEP